MLKWDRNYTVNIDKFDRAHEEFFALVNDLSDTMSGNDAAKMLSDAQNLMRFMQIHFMREESLMQDFKLATMTDHKTEHAQMLDLMEKATKKLREGKTGPMIEFISVLSEWLPEHIQKKDMEYGREVYKRTAKAPEKHRVQLQ